MVVRVAFELDPLAALPAEQAVRAIDRRDAAGACVGPHRRRQWQRQQRRQVGHRLRQLDAQAVRRLGHDGAHVPEQRCVRQGGVRREGRLQAGREVRGGQRLAVGPAQARAQNDGPASPVRGHRPALRRTRYDRAVRGLGRESLVEVAHHGERGVVGRPQRVERLGLGAEPATQLGGRARRRTRSGRVVLPLAGAEADGEGETQPGDDARIRSHRSGQRAAVATSCA